MIGAVFHFRTLCGGVINWFAGTKVPEADLEVHQRQHRGGAHGQGPEGPRGKTLPHPWQGTVPLYDFSLYIPNAFKGFFFGGKD